MTAVAYRPAVAPLLRVAVGGVLAGVLTSYLQGVLPGSWNALANSAAVWTVLAVGLATGCVARRDAAVGAGVLALLGEVAGYYAIASPLRDVATATSERVLWTMAAFVVGPAAGLAAYRLRRGTAGQRIVAGVGLCGVVVGEGLHTLARISDTRLSGWIELELGAAAALIALVVTSATARGRLAAVVTGAGVAAAVFLAYGDTLL